MIMLQMDNADFYRPGLELPARIGWHSKYTEIIFADLPFLVLQVTPVFPCCHPQLAERGIVWDVLNLVDSIRRPGGYYLLTTDCGYAPDSGIEEMVLVSHPDEQTVVWELDVKGLRPTLDDALASGDRFVRLTFARDEYEASIRAMLRDLLARVTEPIALADLSDVHGLDYLLKDYPDLKSIKVHEFEPNTMGEALDRLLELDPNVPFERQPIWSSGTRVECGFFDFYDGHLLMAVDGEPLILGWPTWYFKRWEALAAFKAWLAYVQRGFALPQAFSKPADDMRNKFFLLQESDRAPCHAAGQRLAQVLQQCYEEGTTAPGVSVRYRECPLPVAVVAGCAAPGVDDAFNREGTES